MQGTLDTGAAKRGIHWDRWTRVWREIPDLFRTDDGKFVEASKERAVFPAVRFLRVDDYCLEFSNKGRLPKFNPNPVNLIPIPRPRKSSCLVGGCSSDVDNKWGICKVHTHEFEKRGEKVVGAMRALDHYADWIGSLVNLKTGEVYPAPDHASATGVLIDSWMLKAKTDAGLKLRRDLMDKFMTDALKSIVGEVPDSTTLQLEYEQKRDSPKEVVGIIEGLDNRNFRGLDDQIDWVSDRGKRVFKSLPVRLVAGVLVLGFAAEEANRGDLWFCDKVLGQPDKSGFASAYMSAAYYYLRRYAGANDSQARMSVK